MSIPSPTVSINTPGQGRLFYIGATSCAAGLTWIAAIVSAPTRASADMPLEIFLCLLAAAVALSLAALQLGISYTTQRINSDNQRSIAIAIGQLAAEQESESEKLNHLGEHLDKISPWTIYTAVYEDLLKRGNN